MGYPGSLGGAVLRGGFSRGDIVAQAGTRGYTVGVGATAASDVAVAVQAAPHVKRGERSSVTVQLRQRGLDGLTVRLQLSAQRMAAVEGTASQRTSLGERNVLLERPSQDIEFPYVPDEAGRFQLVAEVEPLEPGA